jgi:integrase
VVSPFLKGDTLISSAEETERMRILTRKEAALLLEKCAAVENAPHLHPVVLTALDTAMRQGELFRLSWPQLDFKEGVITVAALITKTLKRRVVPMSARLRETLLAWREHQRLVGHDVDGGSVFGIGVSVRTSWQNARDAAKLSDLHFHDLRHTAITWMLLAGIPEAKAMKISGHTQWKTFLRYVNISQEIAQIAGRALDEFHATPDEELRFPAPQPVH